MFPAARIGDPVTHDMLLPSGMIRPPLVPTTSGGVIIEGKPAAFVTCTVVCSGAVVGGMVHPPLPPGAPPIPIITGSPTVLIHGFPAARWAPSGDMALCGAFLGDPKLALTRTVLIGSVAAPGAPGVPGTGAPPPEELEPPAALENPPSAAAASSSSADGATAESTSLLSRLAAGELTSNAYTTIELPPAGAERWAALANPANWTPERQALHERLLNIALQQAQAFADAAQDGSPTVFAMRGNTAAGKSRAIRGNIPELEAAVAATKDLPHRAVNPDNFKVDLMRATQGIQLTSQQVHEESSMLARRLESLLRNLRTSDQTEVGSILIDKRLASLEDVVGYGELASETGRKLNVYDVDAPLESSLAGVLERTPGGADPLPPYEVISKGFNDVRANRAKVIAYFQQHPELGKYELYGTAASGAKVKVAEVVNGELTIHDAEQFAQVIENPSAAPAFQDTANAAITADAVEGMVAGLPADRAATVREVMRPHIGKTWKQALDRHSRSS